MGVATRGTATNDRLQTDNSFLEQMKTMVGFRDGQLNCILATSVAEEGLDIPDCNFIVRFDLCQTLIQYIQSRGRARMRDSEYVHMMEMYNTDHRRVVDECRAQETTLRKFCEAMPEDRKLRGFNYDEEFFLQAEKGQRRYKVLSTGATLNYRQSLGCLHGFIASLPHVANTSLVASFAIAPVEGGFQCEVTLPDESPIKSTLGRVHTRKAIAKCSAAFEMCVQLHKQGLLDDNLRPIFEKQLPAMRSARLAISSKKKGEYKRRIKPEVWSITGEPETLHVMVLALSRPDALARKSMPLLLLTREPLVSIPSFRLFFGQDVSSEVICIPLPGTLTGDQLDLVPQATKFTLKLFKDVFSKEYEASSADLPYFLAPANKGHDFDFSTVDDLAQLVDWQALESVQSHDYLDCDYDAPDDFWEGKYIVDPYDGSRKFFLRRRRPGMKATDEVPEGVAAANHRAWKLAADKNIVNYSNGMWVNARKKWVLQENQPVFEAELIPLRRNLLDDDVDEGTLRPRQCFIILQPLKISPVSRTLTPREGEAVDLLTASSVATNLNSGDGIQLPSHRSSYRVKPDCARCLQSVGADNPPGSCPGGFDQGQRQQWGAGRGATQLPGRHGEQLRASRVPGRLLFEDGNNHCNLQPLPRQGRVFVPRGTHVVDLQPQPVQQRAGGQLAGIHPLHVL